MSTIKTLNVKSTYEQIMKYTRNMETGLKIKCKNCNLPTIKKQKMLFSFNVSNPETDLSVDSTKLYACISLGNIFYHLTCDNRCQR